VTKPWADGARFTVYVVPDPEKPEAVALTNVRSETVNPVTLSENVIVTGIGLTLVVEGDVDVIVTPGRTLS
jgi:hypothetical protein